MDVSGSYMNPMAAIGMKVAKQVKASEAQVISSALEGAQKIAANPPPAASARPGGVDIKV